MSEIIPILELVEAVGMDCSGCYYLRSLNKCPTGNPLVSGGKYCCSGSGNDPFSIWKEVTK